MSRAQPDTTGVMPLRVVYLFCLKRGPQVWFTDKRQNNQNVERLNGIVRDKVKSMRGFQRKDTTQLMTVAFRNYYNFIKSHNSHKSLRPAQMVGIGVESGKNKLDDLL